MAAEGGGLPEVAVEEESAPSLPSEEVPEHQQEEKSEATPEKAAPLEANAPLDSNSTAPEEAPAIEPSPLPSELYENIHVDQFYEGNLQPGPAKAQDSVPEKSSAEPVDPLLEVIEALLPGLEDQLLA